MVDYDIAMRVLRPATTLVLHSVALFFFVQTLHRVTRNRSYFGDVSFLLKAFLLLWSVESLSALPTSFYAVLYSQSPWIFDFPWLFYMVIIERSASCGVPVAVFFLTVDRSLTLGLRMDYGRRHQVSVIAATFVSAGCLIGGSAYLYAKHLSPIASRSGSTTEACWRSFCFFEYPDDYQFLVRIVFGAANVAASLVFFALLRSNNRRNKASNNAIAKRRGNTFIKYALASELALNSIPHLSCVLYQLITSTDISAEFGTYSRVLIAIDAVMCATAYRRTRTTLPSGKAVTTVTVSPLSGTVAFTKTAQR